MAPTTNSSSNRWNRGNSYDRARRMRNLLAHWGDGTTAPCIWCGKSLQDMGILASGGGHPDHLTEDHIICHTDGGRYIMSNLVPACDHCNKSRGKRTFHEYAKIKGVADPDAIITYAQTYRRKAK